MSDYPLSRYVVQIAVNTDGNPVVQILPRDPATTPEHPDVPYPFALPAKDFPDALAARDYAGQLLLTAGVLSEHYARQGLVFVGIGHTVVNGRRYAALRAPLPE